MLDGMESLSGEMVLGSDWHLACWYGRGSTKSEIYRKKADMSPISFAQNYESRWVGTVDGALININKFLNLRTLSKSEIKAEKDGEYYLGVDVARSADTSNNQTSISVIKVIRNKNNKIQSLNLINIINISNALNFTDQAREVKKAKLQYNARMAVVDTNGLGVGLCDELMKESFDPQTGKSLGCWDTINTEAKPETDGAERCIFDLKPQSANSQTIVCFIGMVDGGKLRLLEKKQNTDYDINDNDNYIKNVLPFINTDLLIEEVANLKLKQLTGGKLAVEKLLSKINKDRYSSLSYVLWYIDTYESNINDTSVDQFEILTQYTGFF